MQYQIIPVTPFQQNCSIVWCELTGDAAIIDPGGDLDDILADVRRLRVSLKKILLTHGHLDHVGATAELAKTLDLPIEGPHIDDGFWLAGLPEQCRMFGFPPVQSFKPTRWLNHGDSVSVGQQTLEVLHCPGHTPGHVVFFERRARLAWVGDVLFKGTIGRTDFPRGDLRTLLNSIRNELFPLGDDVTFIPGHGPISNFGAERRHNPHVGDTSAQD